MITRRGWLTLNLEEKLEAETDQMHITGTMVAYFHICHRKLWLFLKDLI